LLYSFKLLTGWKNNGFNKVIAWVKTGPCEKKLFRRNAMRH